MNKALPKGNTIRSFLLTALLMLFVLLPVQAADGFSIVGKVVDAHTKKEVASARISVLNEQVAATSEEDGSFSIITTSKSALLIVSAYGYAARQVPVQGKNKVLVELYPDAFSARQYIDQPTAMSSLSDPDKTIAVTADEIIQKGFNGQLRAITRSGAVGQGSSLFIRGLNSINLNAQPLFVVDGVIRDNLYDVQSIHSGFFSNPLANLETSDIASITVLRDGSALYGSKGANGVILITTKRGSGQVTKIDLNISTGVTQTPGSFPMLEADDYRIYLSEMLGSAGLTNEEVQQLPYLNDDPTRSTYKRYHNNTHWQDEIYRNAVVQNYAINVNGGDDKAMYYFALGFANNDDVVKNSNFQRYNMRLNADLKLADNLSSAINIGFSRIDRSLIDDGVSPFTSPSWMTKIKSPFLSPYNFTYQGDLTDEYAFADIFNVGNPMAIIDHSINTVKQNSFNIGFKPVFTVNPYLTISEHFDYYMNKTNEDYYRPYLYTAPIYIQGIGDSYNARMSQVMRSNVIFSDTRVNYKRTFNKLHKVDATIGTRYIYNSYESDYVEGHNSKSNSSINLRGSFKNLVTDGINDNTKSLSHYLSADYAFDHRYFVTAGISLDASSRFGQETLGGMQMFGVSWGAFPSIQGAWLLSSESFMPQTDLLNMVKIKAGYSITGNDDIPNYQSRTYFNAQKLLGVASGIVLSNLANPQIQWETTGRANIGAELGMLNDRLRVDIDLYSSTTRDLLVLKSLPEVVGLTHYWKNEGSMRNTGFELGLNARVLNLSFLKWESALSIGHYKNEIIDLPNGEFITKVYDAEVISRVGESAGVFYGYKTQGVFATENDAQTAGLQMKNAQGQLVSFAAGDVIFEDHFADGIIDEKDKQVIGNPNPDFYGSFTNTFTSGNLSLQALFTFSLGNDIYNYARNVLEAQSDFSNQTRVSLSRWKADGQTTTQPKAVYGDPMGNARFSDRWIEDGSYLRLKSLTLSYKLPVSTDFIEGINLWVSASNLFTMTNYLGLDPEFSAGNAVLVQGIDAGLLPLSRQYAIGVKLNL